MSISVRLTEQEQQYLRHLIHHGTAKGRVRTRAQILLKCAEGWSIKTIGTAFETCATTVYNTYTRWRTLGRDRSRTSTPPSCAHGRRRSVVGGDHV